MDVLEGWLFCTAAQNIDFKRKLRFRKKNTMDFKKHPALAILYTCPAVFLFS